ncbi:SusC/RagA family TonB-linked outer membrane protein [Pararcticibacter amylolyticus]|uniref:TonB-dependent receptor n=1 Tax=Pararcticibacter amylolyticus TaxID=2173175 RepID=A0A2U2PK23_9SPHI|nr:TonB-dependent receptor [Pararcticibacter amylolyticus]PWG81755.1 TonB-dependent receptor [Pararcticibacter amylolyticus]
MTEFVCFSTISRTLKRLVLLLSATFVYGFSGQAQSVVTGRVSDGSGESLPGVTVLVVGSKVSAATNTEGKYRITAGPKDMLSFSFVGMKKKEVAVGGRTVVNVILESSLESLNEVVVVGYGVQKKASLSGAVSSIKGGDLLKGPSTNVSSLLGGRLPGISSVQESGEPGLDQAALKIRGSNYAVTYIVDGMPRSINDIDPNDIESVSVLKDGAAAAVYGLQAAGGVVIITTKKGQSGKFSITYNGSQGPSLNANFPEFMDGPQFAHYYNMADMMDKLANGTITNRDQYTPIFKWDDVEKMTNGDPDDGWDNVNYIDKVFGTGVNRKHNLSLQGGKDDTRYFASLGYLGQDGNIDNFTFKRYNLRTNISTKVANNFNLDLGVAGNVNRRKTPGFVSGGTDGSPYLGEQGWFSIARQAIGMHPYLPVMYDGLYTGVPPRNNSAVPNSPLAAINESGYKKTNSLDLQTNLSLQYNAPWVKGLFLKVTGAYDYSTSYNKNLDTYYYVNAVKLPDATEKGKFIKLLDPRGRTYNSLGEGQYSRQSIVGQGSIGYTNSFLKHNIDFLALTEIRDSKSNSLSAYAKEVAFPELPELGLNTPADSPIGGWSSRSRSLGYVFRLKYNYDEKYLAEFTGRYDGSYKFAGNVDGKRWGFFPSASVAWRASKENFMEKFTFIDDLKLRASVGLLGNDNVSEYSFLSTYSFGGKIPLNGALQNSMYTSVIANPNLSWEKTLSYNAGFDLTMFKGLFGAEFDVFYTHTYDILTGMSSGYPPSMGGYYFTYENFSGTDAKGFELLLKHTNTFNLAGKPFKYNVTPNVTYAVSHWVKYPDSPNSPEIQKVTGKKTTLISGWVAEGLFRSEEEIDNAAWFDSRPNLGDIKYKDLNGDGKIDYQDRGLIGRSNRPELTYGLNLGGEWNGFDFNAQFTGGALFDISMTGTYYNYYDDNTIWTQTFKEGANSPLFLVENAYSIDNPNGTFPRITLSSTTHGGDNGLASTFWFRNGRYVRLKSAQLGYSIPKKILSKIGVERFRLFVEGSNIFTISGLPKGIDPESPGVNNGYYPQQKVFTGGVSLTF